MTNVHDTVTLQRLPSPDDDGTLMLRVQDLVSNVAPELHFNRTVTPAAGTVTGLHATQPGMANGLFDLVLRNGENDWENRFGLLGTNRFKLEVYNHRANPRLSTDAAYTQVPLVNGRGEIQVVIREFVPVNVLLENGELVTRDMERIHDARIQFQNRADSIIFRCYAFDYQFDAVSRFFMNVVRAALNMDPL